jgi:hypothetical protein
LLSNTIRIAVLCSTWGCHWASQPVFAQSAQPSQVQNQISPELIAWLERLVKENLPATYTDKREWGKQREVFDGVHIDLDGMKLHTRRKSKMVNAGSWKRYDLRFIDPENQVKVQFHTLKPIEGGRIEFATTIDANLEVSGQMQEWVLGVMLGSFSMTAVTQARLSLQGVVDVKLNILQVPPAIIIKPNVQQAHIDVVDYRVTRLGRIDGDPAKVFGKSLRLVVDQQIDKANETLADRINRKLTAKPEKLTFSMRTWLTSKLPVPEQPKASR